MCISWFNLAAKIGVFVSYSRCSPLILGYVPNYQSDGAFGISGKFTDLCRLLEPKVPLNRY
jgi:hypothetical protein